MMAGSARLRTNRDTAIKASGTGSLPPGWSLQSAKENIVAKHVEIDDTNPDAVHQQVDVSPELAKITGEGPMARGEVTSRIWDHIKKNDLQSEADGRDIEPDEMLAAVVGKGKLTMFEMTAKVNAHIRGPEKAAR
jgi:chromatin remodeling complex protein RSC6